jgi:prepilin peptidase CpaA
MHSTVSTVFLLALVCAAAYGDLRTRRIPNALTVAGLVAGLGLRVPLGGGAVLDGLGGFAAALALGIPFFAAGALGGGDVKLLAAVGAFTGWSGLLETLVAVALAGAALALFEGLRRGVLVQVFANTGKLALYCVTLSRYGARPEIGAQAAVSVPYGVAIAAGAIVARLA